MGYNAIASILAGHVTLGTTVTVKGWVRTKRDSKAGYSFIAIHDGSSFDSIQVVAESELNNYQEEVTKITTGCSVEITGTLAESQGKGQAFEIKANDVAIIGWVEKPDSYPMQPKRHSMEYLREVAHLRPRTNLIGAVTRIRNAISYSIHEYLQTQGFQWIHTPIITASDCEGAGEMFRVSTLDLENLPRNEAGKIDYTQDFFGTESFLTVSGQLNVESYCLALSKVYTFGPTFRAENSNTSRHLAEFWMIEPEIAFADLNTVIDVAHSMLKHVFTTLLEQRQDDLDFLVQRVDDQAKNRLENFVKQDLVRMTYTEAIDILSDCGKTFEYPVNWGIDLQTEHERYLCEDHANAPVVVTDYPKDIKAFYMRLNDDQKTVSAMDVLAPGIGEIIGGSQREERLPQLDARLEEMQLPKEEYWWYRDLRRYGTVPHGGFGLGLERLVSYVCGVGNVRDVIPFPRTRRSVTF